MSSVELRRWEVVGAVALAVIVVAIPVARLSDRPISRDDDGASPTFVGRDSCVDCHRSAYEEWHGSDHDLAMAEATEDSVLGDFDDAVLSHRDIDSRFYRRDDRFYVWTEGPGGEMAEFEIAYTFGHDPLQQYLVRFPGGRLQALSLAWDVVRRQWFHLYPDQEIPPEDWLHWTRNAQNWNGMCAECHSTDLRKRYDPVTQSYTTTWSEIDVSCEACHGPGSRHVAWASIQPMARPEIADYGLVVSTEGIEPTHLVELCAPCHSRHGEIGDYDHSGHNMLDHMLPSLLREGLYHADGQILDEVYVYGSFLQSKMYTREVTCSDCHSSHSLELRHEGNELCLQCHQREVYDTSDHHFHKKVHEGKASDGALCVSCHMVEQPYMVIDWRADHGFRVPRPDLSLEIGTPNACNQDGCHTDRSIKWSVDAFRKWYGQARKPHFGTTFAAARSGEASAEGELIRLAENVLQPAIVRATALELLERYPSEAAAATLRLALQDGEPLLRHTAVQSLLVADQDEEVSLLAPLLSDPIKAIRMAAVSRLAGVPLERLKSYQREAYRSALAEYQEAMSRSLDFAASGMNLGNLYTRLGRQQDAERHYRLALEIDDLFFPAKLNLAVLLSGQGRNPEAETLLREVLEAYPDNHQAAYSLALLLVEMGEPAEGVEWLRRAAEGMPTHARAHYNLGLLLQQLGQDREAERRLGEALQLEPDNLDFLYALADFYMKRSRFSETLEIADRMISANPEAQIGHDIKALVERATAEGPRP